MKIQKPLFNSTSSEKALVESRLDIPAGAELSPALRRLVEEVRMEATAEFPATSGYDRMHNRHNR
ncbi:MAG: hypothetical protein OXH11_07190 [Candidatus Aminicenantes bacterium]|nr:hypothetical protein [Candidatus Aminicenantes bacterium]